MTLDKYIIEKFLQKDVRITFGTISYTMTGKIIGIDDLGILVLEKNIGAREKYIPIFNIIQIEDIEKEK